MVNETQTKTSPDLDFCPDLNRSLQESLSLFRQISAENNPVEPTLMFSRELPDEIVTDIKEQLPLDAWLLIDVPQDDQLMQVLPFVAEGINSGTSFLLKKEWLSSVEAIPGWGLHLTVDHQHNKKKPQSVIEVDLARMELGYVSDQDAELLKGQGPDSTSWVLF